MICLVSTKCMGHCIKENDNQEICFIPLQEQVARNCAKNPPLQFAEKILHMMTCTH